MDLFSLIKTRRSVRRFTDEPVSDETIDKIIEAGTWAPSGKNNQPWRFAVIRDHTVKSQVSELTHYAKCVLSAHVLIAVFLDETSSYHKIKDAQAIGSCIQNMLLTIHDEGLGAVWLGEILKNGDRVRDLVNGSRDLELMAVIAIGHPAGESGTGSRKEVEQTIFFRR
jgi:nitroreductase